MPGIWLWSALIGVSLFLVIVPWLPPRPRQGAVAVVDLANCNGCGRCEVDCPYNAIQMAPRSDARSYAQEAVVIPSLCMSCGICVGACPTATPYRRASDLIPGIDLPETSMRELRERTVEAAKQLEASPRVLVYGCAHGPNLIRLEGPGVAVLELECAAMLPPAFLDFVLSRGHAEGVFLTGCREEDCFHRLGVQWTQERIARERDPYLRERVPRERIATCWSGRARGGELARELAAFRERLAKQGDTGQRPGEKKTVVEANAS
jgi:ferredoxin